MGDLNSRLLGIIFVMKFQAAAMARANLREEERLDFTLYVDEFQNFTTDSFETILSEARKYRLSLVLGNQFMTQLKEELREAIIGNVGTTITGRIGITDAEIMVKRYAPVFDAEDLTKLPNYQSVAVAQIEGVPSAPFSMSWIAPLGQSNEQLSDALKRLSAAKYGRPRGQIEQEIFKRLSVEKAANAVTAGRAQFGPGGMPSGQGQMRASQPKASGGSSFLDEWLSKRKQLSSTKPMAPTTPQQPQAIPGTAPVVATVPVNKPVLGDIGRPVNTMAPSAAQPPVQPPVASPLPPRNEDDTHLDLRNGDQDNSVSVKIR